MSLKMLTDKDNKNKNINYLGFDPGEKSIQKANTFNFTILKPELESLKKYYNDSFLAYPIDSLSSISLEKIKLFFIFHKYFQFIKEKNINIHNIGPNTASLYKLKEKYRNNINFQTGNVLEMNKIVKKNSADVIFFKNALYHLTHDDNRIEKNRLDSFNILNKLVNEIDNALGNNGLFVIGSLKTSHTKRISDILYILLDIKNFKPIYFENNLPAIWQKQIIKKFNNFI